jgi:hypothetical protein
MVPLYARFRDLAFREMRSATVLGDPIVPPGEYGFLELYCDEPHCDCRRVVLQVLRSDTGARVWATINYGWETIDFYERWFHGDRAGAADMAGATLDPLNEQSEHSDGLLRLFRDVVLRDAAYVERLKRHYRLFKATKRPARRDRRRERGTGRQ